MEAFAMADSLEAHGTPAIVAPLRLRGRGVFYRVHAGPFASAAHADSVLTALRASGLIARTAGTRDSLPLSVALGAGLTQGAARAERIRLRAAGVAAFILGSSDSTFRLFAGAYNASAQGKMLQDLLTPTGSAGDLVPRAGYVP
jgi:cell division septation protein DedD